jgi:hypothetical protein
VRREDASAAFLALSAELTAFSEFDLRGTGQAEAYRRVVADVVGEEVLGELLDAYQRAGDLRRDVLSHEKLGPIAKNLIKMWYAGVWYELPPEWTDTFGALENDVTFVVSPDAYTEGLLWPAIGAHPPGAKAPGYGSWTAPPRIETLTPEGAPAP